MSLSLIKKGVSKFSNGLTKLMALITVNTMLAVDAVAAGTYDFGNLVDNGKGINDVAENAESSFSIIFNVIKALGVLVGLVFVFMGVLRLKKSQDQNSGVSPMQGIILIIVGGLMAVLPWLLITSATTVQGEG